MAGRDGARAFIFTERTMALAHNHVRVQETEALSFVIVHELGHLLLPDSGHSPTGLMQAAYDLLNQSARRFTPAEADAIRQRLVFEQSEQPTGRERGHQRRAARPHGVLVHSHVRGIRFATSSRAAFASAMI
jgi:hypothetical protein